MNDEVINKLISYTRDKTYTDSTNNKILNIINEMKTREVYKEKIADVSLLEMLEELKKDLKVEISLNKYVFKDKIIKDDNAFMNINILDNENILTTGLLEANLNDIEPDNKTLLEHAKIKMITNDIGQLYIEDKNIYVPYNLYNVEEKRNDILFNAFLNVALKNNSFTEEIKKYLKPKQKHI